MFWFFTFMCSSLIIADFIQPSFAGHQPDDFAQRKDHYRLIISIMSGPENIGRRNALRQTWLSKVSELPVSYHFLSDMNVEDELDVIGFEAIQKHGITKNIWNHRPTGEIKNPLQTYSFSLLNQHAMMFALEKYSFDFYLRIDDDSFLCLESLLDQLQHLPSSQLYAGRWHRSPQNLRPDESFVLFSRDVVRYLAYPPLPFSHMFFGGLAFGKFLQPFELKRLDCSGLFSNLPLDPDIRNHFCSTHLSTHHVEPSDIFELFSKNDNSTRSLNSPRNGTQSWVPIEEIMNQVADHGHTQQLP